MGSLSFLRIGLLTSFRRPLALRRLTLPALLFCGALVAPRVEAADSLTATPPLHDAPALLASGPLPPLPRATRVPPMSLALLAPQAAVDVPGGLRHSLTPERRALLNTIRFAPGTWARREALGHRILFGGGLSPRLSHPPRRGHPPGRVAGPRARGAPLSPTIW